MNEYTTPPGGITSEDTRLERERCARLVFDVYGWQAERLLYLILLTDDTIGWMEAQQKRRERQIAEALWPTLSGMKQLNEDVGRDLERNRG